MINKKELRIGNYISRLDLGSLNPRIEKILELYGKRAVTTGPTKVIVLYEDIKPIPLTEEWLIKFGFVKLGTDDYFYIYEYNMNLKISCDLSMVAWYNLSLNGVMIKHVHQLQNLYFALTNEEL